MADLDLFVFTKPTPRWTINFAAHRQNISKAVSLQSSTNKNILKTNKDG